MRNAGLEEAQAGIKIARRNINNLRYADNTSLMAESEEELKGLLMKEDELALCIKWPMYWSFSFSISPSNEYSTLISFRMGWFDLPAVQETFKSLLQKKFKNINS